MIVIFLDLDKMVFYAIMNYNSLNNKTTNSRNIDFVWS